MSFIQNITIGEPIAPEPVAFSFEAPGWTYLVIGVLLIILLIGFYWLWSYQKNAYRRKALKQIHEFNGNSAEKARFANTVLKRTALDFLPRSIVTDSENAFYLSLNGQVKKAVFNENDAALAREVNYGDSSAIAETELDAHLSRIILWIKKHKSK